MDISQTSTNGQIFGGASSAPTSTAPNPTALPQIPPNNINNNTTINIQQTGGNESELSMNSKEENYDDEEFDEEDDEENHALMQGDYNIHVATEYKSEEVDEDVPYYTDNGMKSNKIFFTGSDRCFDLQNFLFISYIYSN